MCDATPTQATRQVNTYFPEMLLGGNANRTPQPSVYIKKLSQCEVGLAICEHHIGRRICPQCYLTTGQMLTLQPACFRKVVSWGFQTIARLPRTTAKCVFARDVGFRQQ